MTEEQAAELIDHLATISEILTAPSQSTFSISQYVPLAALALSVFGLFWALKLQDRQRIVNRERRKTDLTVTLSLEWDSRELLQRRIAVEQFLLDDRSPTFSEMHKKMTSRKPTSGVEWVDVSRILHFLEMLGRLAQKEKLDQQLYRNLFRDELSAWDSLLMPRLRAEPDKGWHGMRESVEGAIEAAK